MEPHALVAAVGEAKLTVYAGCIATMKRQLRRSVHRLKHH